MNLVTTCLILLFISNTRADVHIDEWDYDHHHIHQENWSGTCKTGQKQSPVNFDTKQTVAKTWNEPFRFAGYDKKISVLLKNNRHTVVMTPIENDTEKIAVSGGGLGRSKFQFLQAHFHWGSTNNQGSEHTVDSKYSPMEMHLVHWNLDVGSTLTKAVKKDAYNSLEVLGVQFKIGDENKKFEPIFRAIRRIMQENSNATIGKEIILRDLLPENMLEYYRYKGSLTTPPCNEVVIWTIFKQPIEISQSQLDDIRRASYLVEGETGPRYISDNYRSTQPLNGRKVEYITTEVLFHSDGNMLKSNTFFLQIFFITFSAVVLFF